MKSLFAIVLIAIVSLLAGCATSGKLIATSSTSVDHAMQAWAVYVVDGRATVAQEASVRVLKEKYDLSEDAAVAAFASFTQTGDKTAWQQASAYLQTNEANLISLIYLISGTK